ncbi:MAG: uracil-DNA glycosylase [Halieaceae bacterium]|nr:uracil-DNA glycosylase [Halieaceae bacterium]
MPDVRLDPAWQRLLGEALQAPHMQALRQFLRDEVAAGKSIFPSADRIFAALDATPPDRVRVVVLGQDPYHGPGQAHGLSFSVPRGVPIPPSLRNIYRALDQDLGIAPAAHGDLSAWAEQGVLLLNAVLTVEAGKAGSHQGRGWEQFTDAIVAALNQRATPLVFMLWGKPAQQKGAIIDRDRHCVLEAPHPSPLSAYRGFFDCGHFSAANQFLVAHGLSPIDWRIPD